MAFQSTRPVRGGTRNSITHVVDEQISIHPPRAGRDVAEGDEIPFTKIFQSTRPVRGGTFARPEPP